MFNDNQIVILDLDNTLVHAVEPEEFKDVTYGVYKPDFEIHNKEENYKFLVFKRPYVDDFLKYLFKHTSKVIVWSAGTKDYVDLVVKKLFHRRKPYLVLSRATFNTAKTKNIDKFLNTFSGKKMIGDKVVPSSSKSRVMKKQDIIFIDDIPEKIRNLHKSQIIHIPPYEYNNTCDTLFKPFARKRVLKIKPKLIVKSRRRR